MVFSANNLILKTRHEVVKSNEDTVAAATTAFLGRFYIVGTYIYKTQRRAGQKSLRLLFVFVWLYRMNNTQLTLDWVPTHIYLLDVQRVSVAKFMKRSRKNIPSEINYFFPFSFTLLRHSNFDGLKRFNNQYSNIVFVGARV